METQSTRKLMSSGSCAFCNAELEKNKMTQHLKSCKQRRAQIATQEEKSQETKTRLFHILAEGRYNPQYWLHFEVPASESLWSLDHFLKDMWIDDLDHLSGFTINGTNYSDDYPDDFFSFSDSGEKEEGKEEENAEEGPEKEVGELVDEVVSRFAEGYVSFLDIPLEPAPFSGEWIAEIKKPRSVYELIDFLKEERSKIKKEGKSVLKDDHDVPLEETRKRYSALNCRRLVVEELLDAVEDRSMDAPLENVLKVGEKFSYIYDYGSSTYINLRVVAEREGIVQDEKKPVQLLAQNIAPAFPCVVCGKPGTKVAIGYFTDSIENSAYCTKCSKKQVEEGETMPIINSPRVGVL